MKGSSPRVRGTGLSLRSVFPASGIIPACAGNSATCEARCRVVRDHPRVCGEQLYCVLTLMNCLGSSPRVRGTAFSDCFLINRAGIIPACAGNSLAFRLLKCLYKDHPRVCGEQRFMMKAGQPVKGSSPRVRGTVDNLRYFKAHRRIIPACAGNRWHRVRSSYLERDHPRVCGEQAPSSAT